jgi:hypothetical protein
MRAQLTHRLFVIAALALLITVPVLAQKGDFTPRNVVESYPDGSLVINGTHYESHAEFQQSDEFKEGGHRCATPHLDILFRDLSSDIPDKLAADCSMTSTTIKSEYNPSGGALYTIPVVFHVIQKTDGTGNLATSLLTSQIDILNEDFRALAGTPGAGGTDTKIQFVLATTDPNGNSHSGINRVTSNAYFTDPGPGAYNDMKDALNWDTSRYLNIYTNDANGALGYATFPQQDAEAYNDGVVLLHTSVGRNSPGGGIYNQGRTATHEVGHYLGLFHTFQSGCGSAGAPYTTGDLIADTNRQSAPNYNCPGGASSCSSSDPIENYMNYTQDTCMDTFTSEQTNRMRCSITSYRSTLVGGGGGGGGGGPTALTNGVPETGLAGSTGAEDFFTLDVPAGATNLTFTTSGGSGDADLYVRFGSAPTTGTYDCRSWNSGNSESCSFATPSTGTYHVLIHAYSTYSGMSLTGSFTPPSGGGGAPCTGCDEYTGSLTGSGDADIHPNGTWYQSFSSGTHDGWLEGPGGADFDLELYRWNGSGWTKVAESISSTSDEEIHYSGTAGYYYWRVVSYSGSGSYTLWLDVP